MTRDLFSLIELLELTRNQPIYGYALARIPIDEQGDLAEHHYLTTMIAWQLAQYLADKGGTVDVNRVIQLALVHDLGELFGGDIAAPYARANPAARKAAKSFEAENQRFLAQFFGSGESKISQLFSEEADAESVESQIVKISDFIEHTHFKRSLGRMGAGDTTLVKNVCDKRLGLIRDTKTQTVLRQIIDEWLLALNRPDTELFEADKLVNRE